MIPSELTNELTISQIDRKHLRPMIDTVQAEPFQIINDLVTRSFTFGRESTTCDTVRSEVLIFLRCHLINIIINQI